MSVRVDSDQVTAQPQSFSAGFELTGSTQAGELILYTPLGSTAASLSWTPLLATLRTNDEVRQFESLNALVKQAIGTDLPVSALFAWLTLSGSFMGTDAHHDGWEA